MITELPQGWENRLGGHKQNLVHTRAQEKGAVTPQDTEPDWPVSLQESSSGLGQQWPALGAGTLTTTVLEAEVCWHRSF